MLSNLSHSLSTASTLELLGRWRSPPSWRLYGGSAKIQSTDFSGRAFISSMQSPMIIFSVKACFLLLALVDRLFFLLAILTSIVIVIARIMSHLGLKVKKKLYIFY